MKIQRRTLLLVTAMGAGSTLLQACGGGDDDAPPPATEPQNIVQIASANPDFSVLVSAVVKANLATTLSGSDLFTVFAPTNAAFNAAASALGFTDGAALVAALSSADLAKVLLYHVASGRNLAASLSAGPLPTAYVFEGTPASVTLSVSSGVVITDSVLTQATVTTADLVASNGVIHVINKLLVPPGVLNIVQMAQLNPIFSTLVGAVVAAGLTDDLSAAPPPQLTVFAPVNDAFAAIQSTVDGLTTPQLETVLKYHVLGTQVLAANIPFGTPVATLATPQTITINNNATAPAIATIVDTTPTAADIVAVNIRASNGVIHVINKVLLPSL